MQRQPRVSGEIGPESRRGRGEAESRGGPRRRLRDARRCSKWLPELAIEREKASSGLTGGTRVFPGGRALEPHNIDSLRQKYLLLICFTEVDRLTALIDASKVEGEGGRTVQFRLRKVWSPAE